MESSTTTRQKIEKIVQDAFRKRIILSERAAISLEHLYFDHSVYSWQLKLLWSIMQTTPAIYNSLVAINSAFGGFDYKKLKGPIERAKIRSEKKESQGFRFAIEGLISEPDPGEIHVVHVPGPYVPKRKVVGSSLTVDDLIRLLFWNLFYGEYVSDLALALLILDRRPIDLCRNHRHWLEAIEGFATTTHIIDPDYSSQQWILFSDGTKYRIRPFGAWSINKLDERPLKDGTLWIARSNLVQPTSRFSDDAIAELEDLINMGAEEKCFQRFFEVHPEFLLGLGLYQAIHPHMILHEDSSEKLIPDFFLEKMTGDYCDILDLKSADVELFRLQKYRFRFRDAIMEGVAQLERYRNWFEDRTNRQAFYDRYGLRAYRPRVTLIIGRKKGIWRELEEVRAMSLLPEHINLMTYSEVVENARRYKRLFFT